MKSVRYLWLLVLASSIARADAAEVVIPPASQRFAQDGANEAPDFQRHVLPLMGRLGCNGRACHGSFQGQGGFQLSLFGYDFTADHKSVTGGDEPRINADKPLESLMLQKPTEAVDHGGGKRFEINSWQHRLLHKWITSGAKPADLQGPQFKSLEVLPHDIAFKKPGDSLQLKVLVRWSDGSCEDVTPLCRYTTNDESVAEVNEDGLVKCKDKGDTHIVVFYDNGVEAVPVLLPISDQLGPRYPQVPTPTKIDELVVNKLRKLGVVPSDLSADDEFLRRVSLDMTGTLPAPAEIRTFLADRSPDKRRKKIDELLQRPTYAAWWATKLNDWMGNSPTSGPVGGEQSLGPRFAVLWYDWVYRRVRDNVPYDKIVEGVVLGVSRTSPDQSYQEYCEMMTSYLRSDNPADFAERETMPYYWGRKTVGSNEAKGMAFAYSFLGVRLECAQCHKHPFDQWTKQDFDEFAAFFSGISYRAGGDRKLMEEMKKELGLAGIDEDMGSYKRALAAQIKEGKVAPFKEVGVSRSDAKRAAKARAEAIKKFGRVLTPHLLGGEEVLTYEYDDPRQPLMDWMRQDDNPYFAKAVVNRVWANYFNVGIVDPPDDMNLANAPSNDALLAYLAKEFIAHKYDLKWLHREIANSRTYQLTWRTNETNINDERNFSHSVIRRLPAEVAYDAMVTATATDEAWQKLVSDDQEVHNRGIGVASTTNGIGKKGNEQSFAFRLFGKPARVTNCDCERSAEPNLLQTVYMQNDYHVFQQLNSRNGWIAHLATTELTPEGRWKQPEKVVDAAYLRTLSRAPQAGERQTALEYLTAADDPQSGLSDLLWALLNTKEFILNH